MKIEEMLEQHRKAAQDILEKAKNEDRDLTDAEMAAFDAAETAYHETVKRMETARGLTDRLSSMAQVDAGEAEEPQEKAATLGEGFTTGVAYKAFSEQVKRLGGVGRNSHIQIDPTQVGSMKDFFAHRKAAALGTSLAHLQNVRLPLIDQVTRPELTLLDLISTGTTSGAFEYLQLISVTRNTAIVPENTGNDDTDKLKPQSEFATQLADAKVYDYADGYTVTNQLLQDDQALASFLNSEFRYSFDRILADKLLNGSGESGEPKGLLHTTGVQAHEWTAGTKPALGLIEGVRKSLTKLKAVGAATNAILVSPEDAEAIDLLRDANERFYGQGPFGTGPATLWGRPLVESDQLEAGTFIAGDFRQIALLDRSGLSVQAFNQHKDYAARNLTYVRAEMRAAQAIWRPAHLLVGTKGA